MQAQHSLFTWMLAQFYMGQVFAKLGQQSRAKANYAAFRKHFEHSSGGLPQIDEARKLFPDAPAPENGKLLFADEFSGAALGRGWSVTGMGKWQVGGGLLNVSIPGHDVTDCEQ